MINSSVWVVEGTDHTAYCDDGAVTIIVGIGASELEAKKLKHMAQSRKLDYSFLIYEVDLSVPLPFGEENPDIGARKRREASKK